jgi:hypothetical protein
MIGVLRVPTPHGIGIRTEAGESEDQHPYKVFELQKMGDPCGVSLRALLA